MFIYALHLEDGAYRYIGLTKTTLKNRLRQHRSTKTNTPVSKWIQHHGRDAIRITEIEVCSTEIEMVAAEIRWIAKLRAEGFDLLNVHPGGHYSSYRPLTSDELREKLRQSHLGQVNTPDQRRKISEALKGIKRSDETKEKLRQIALARGNSGGMTGRKHSAETLEKMRVAQQKRSAEGKNLGGKANAGRKRPDNIARNKERAWENKC